MELMIYSPQQENELPPIKWNYEEIKAFALEKANEYKSIAYTDEDAAAMKKDRADINRFINALEAARKEKKREYLLPYNEFEAQVKDALLPLREAEEVITKGLAEIEQQYRAAKTEKMKSIYAKYAGDLTPLVPFQKTVKEEYYKKTFKDKHLEEAYQSLFETIRTDLDAIDQLPERFRERAVARYSENFNLADALREGKRLEEVEKAMEERRRLQEEERLRREAELAAAAAAKQAEVPVMETVPDNVELADDSVAVPVVPAEEVIVEKAAAEEPEQEKIIMLDFRVWATREQLSALRDFMVGNNIRFGKVD